MTSGNALSEGGAGSRTRDAVIPSGQRGARALRMEDLLREIPGAQLVGSPRGDAWITGVHQDSRRVEPGDLFVARSGAQSSGERFIAEAIAKGAQAVVVEEGSSVRFEGAARIEARDVPAALAFAAAAVYRHPTFALDVVGVTGTNGKTTTTHLIQTMINACGGRTGLVGTLGSRLGNLVLPAMLTTPPADDLARIAAGMRAEGATHMAMEVSSIALVARRVDAVRFRVAAFTNLTPDHLDFHGSMEAYAAAKARLFTELAPGAAAINVDNAFGRQLVEMVAKGGARGPKGATLARFSARVGASESEAEIAPVELSFTREGIALKARTPAGTVQIRSSLSGAHNVENLLTALSVAYLLELDVAAAAAGLSGNINVPGRLERCDTPSEDDVIVFVDYAHTPDALERVLASVRAQGQGRVLCVFGCGGDRDATKRPLMGKAVGQGADVAIVTNDNPRSEDPQAIAEAILPGLEGGRAEVMVELDRRRAIECAVLSASPGDVVLIAGKGHEPYQIVGAETLSFDDREEARRALSMRRASRREG